MKRPHALTAAVQIASCNEYIFNGLSAIISQRITFPSNELEMNFVPSKNMDNEVIGPE